MEESREEKLTESSPLIYSSVSPDTTKFKRNVTSSKSKSCRNLVTFSALWITYLVVSVAYSILAPFYPQEVCLLKLFYCDSMCFSVVSFVMPLCYLGFGTFFCFMSQITNQIV